MQLDDLFCYNHRLFTVRSCWHLRSSFETRNQLKRIQFYSEELLKVSCKFVSSAKSVSTSEKKTLNELLIAAQNKFPLAHHKCRTFLLWGAVCNRWVPSLMFHWNKRSSWSADGHLNYFFCDLTTNINSFSNEAVSRGECHHVYIHQDGRKAGEREVAKLIKSKKNLTLPV